MKLPHTMFWSFLKRFRRKKQPASAKAADTPTTSFIHGNGWLACKQALTLLKDMSPGPLAPLKMALVGVLACMEHVEKVSGSQEEFVKLARKINGFQEVFRPYQSTVDISPAMQDYLDRILRDMERISKTSESKTERHLGKRTIHAFRDVTELKELVDDLDYIVQEFKLRCDLDTQFEVKALATDGILSKLRHVSNAGIDASDEDGCMEGTRVELLKKLQDWSRDPTERSIFWLDGMAGTGKSAICRSFSRFLRENKLLGGSFFCRRGQESRSDVKRILPTLAWLLARRDPYYREPLLQYLKNQPDIADCSIEMQVKYLLEEPLRHQRDESRQIPLVLVIDALDECADDGQVKQLLDKLLSISNLPIKFFLASRPEHYIRAQFESPESRLHRVLRLHNIEHDIVDADISRYLTAQLRRIRTSTTAEFPAVWPSTRDVARLTELAGKLFIYAFTAVKYIEQRDPNGRLQKLTGQTTDTVGQPFYNNMNNMYALVLAAATDPETFDESDIIETKRILTAVLATREPLCLSGLAILLGISSLELRMNLDRLHAVIFVPTRYEDGLVYTFHASFGEYLTTSGRAPEHLLLSLDVGHRTLANGCLQEMENNLKFNITNCKSSHLSNTEQPTTSVSPSLRYSCLHWVNHFVDAAGVEALIGTVEKFLYSRFLYWVEVLSVTGASKFAPSLVMRILMTDRVKQVMTVDLITFLRDANEFVTLFQDPISFSAPHIYISALPFLLGDSEIGKKFRPMFKRTIKLTSQIKPQQKTILGLRGHTEGVWSVGFSPDGTHIVSGSYDNTIRVWNAKTGEEVMKPIKGHSNSIWTVGFSPDGKRIVSGSYDRTIRVWNARTGDEVMEPILGHNGGVSCISFSPDGSRMASGSFDWTIRIWDAAAGKQVMEPFSGHAGNICSVCFSPDGTQIVSGSDDKTIRLWNATTGEEVLNLDGHTESVSSVAFSPDGTCIVSGSDDNTIRIWDAKTGQQVLKPLTGHVGWVCSVSFSPDGSRIVSGSYDKTIRIWDANSGEEMMKPLDGHTDWVSCVRFSPDGRHIISGSYDKTVRLWDAGEGEGVTEPHNGHDDSVCSVSFSPDGTRFVSGSHDGTVRVWKAETGEEDLNPLEGHTEPISSVGFSPDGTQIVSSSFDKTIRLWDATTGKESMAPLNGHLGGVQFVCFAPDGTRIVSCSVDRTIRVWDAKTGKEVMNPFDGHTGGVTCICFSPDGKRIASGSYDKTIRVWDMMTGEQVMKPLNGHTGGVCSIVYSPDGTRIASGSYDKTIRLWDTKSGEQVIQPFNGHAGVSSVNFSPDGAYIVSGSNDKTVRLWDAKTGREIMEPIKGHTNRVRCVAFSPDGAYIVSGSDDKTIRVWDAHKTYAEDPVDEQSATLSSSHFSIDARKISLYDRDGWIAGPTGQLIFWVPLECRPGLLLPPCKMVIGPQIFVDLLEDFVHGDEWASVYIPPHT